MGLSKLQEKQMMKSLDFLKTQTQLILFASIMFLLLLTVLFLLYRNQRIKNKKNLLEQQNILLRNENRVLKSKNTPVSSITETVSEQKEQEHESGQVQLSVKKFDSTGNEYSVLFQHSHQDFYNNLYQKHPDLTSNEKKLSAFIRLNMSSKEISSITFQSVKSIEIARSRLRKKLNLRRNMNLNAYLQGF